LETRHLVWIEEEVRLLSSNKGDETTSESVRGKTEREKSIDVDVELGTGTLNWKGTQAARLQGKESLGVQFSTPNLRVLRRHFTTRR